MTPKSPKIEPWGLQKVVKKLNLFLTRFRDPPWLVFLPFWGPFWDPKTVQICEKTRKIRCPKITWFFHGFYAGLGVVFQRFFSDFLGSKFRGSLESDFVKKLTKHWPWRQNQGSAFWKFIICLICLSKIIIFWQGRFRTDFWPILGGFWDPQIQDFRIVGLIFQDKFRVIFWKA